MRYAILTFYQGLDYNQILLDLLFSQFKKNDAKNMYHALIR